VRELADRIRRQGPIPFRVFMEAALYEPGRGFFAAGGGAGRRGGDFITSPEVGPLFGVCVARGLEEWWRLQGAPDPFVVVEAGAGTGRLAREVLRAEPAFLPALRYVLVERAEALREVQRERLTIEPFSEALGPAAPAPDGEAPVPVTRVGPIVSALDDLPAPPFEGVVLANELLDNLPFDLAERSPRGWDEIRVGVSSTDRFHEVRVPVDEELAAWLDGIDVPAGTRVPVQRAVEEWLETCSASLRRGLLVLVDYVVATAEVPGRAGGWLRTYRAHDRGADPLEAPGSQDITADLLREPLRRAADRHGFTVVRESSQAEWLRDLGIDALVAEGRAAWEAGAARGDLAALAGRSRATEAAALTDPAGLGAHTVLVLAKP
jgi:SAM-dependent MidA family methyltransferase